jgi:hypothetical protein
MKTPIALIVLVISIAAATAGAQDIIVLRNGDEIKSKVIEITPTEIKYKKFDNLGGPTIDILKSDVFMIKYANGTKDVMASSISPASTESGNAGSANPASVNSGAISLYMMPLGFLEFGPVLGAEYAATPNVSVGAHVRIASLGLLTYAITVNDNGDDADNVSGLGIGADVKYYPLSVRSGFYCGGLLEFLWGTATYYQGSSGEYMNTTSFMAIACDGGYKFDLSQSFYLNVGATLGAALPLDAEPTVHPNDPDNTDNWNQGKTTIFGMLDVTVGVNL